MDEVLAEIRRVLRDELGLARDPRLEDDLVTDLQARFGGTPDAGSSASRIAFLRIALAEEDAARCGRLAISPPW